MNIIQYVFQEPVPITGEFTDALGKVNLDWELGNIFIKLTEQVNACAESKDKNYVCILYVFSFLISSSIMFLKYQTGSFERMRFLVVSLKNSILTIWSANYSIWSLLFIYMIGHTWYLIMLGLQCVVEEKQYRWLGY